LTDRIEYIKTAIAKYNSYSNEWQRDYFNYDNGGYVVVFEFKNNTKKIQEELDKLKRMNIKVYYYFTDNKTINVL